MTTSERMLTTEEQLVMAVTSAPHDDAPRRAYADWVRPYDPRRAKFIEMQLAWAEDSRTTRRGYSNPTEGFLDAHADEWSRTFLKYVTRADYYRGFIEDIAIDPYIFLEYGEFLFVNAPILSVTFLRPEEGPFPLEELLASPLLARLNCIVLKDGLVDDAAVEMLAASPHLENCLWLDLSGNVLTIRAFAALARNASTRKLLVVERAQSGYPETRYDPGQQYELTDRLNRWDTFISELGPVKPEGQALERTYGYLPWLHRENSCDALDAHWFVQHGVLPVRPAGSPVE